MRNTVIYKFKEKQNTFIGYTLYNILTYMVLYIIIQEQKGKR